MNLSGLSHWQNLQHMKYLILNNNALKGNKVSGGIHKKFFKNTCQRFYSLTTFNKFQWTSISELLGTEDRVADLDSHGSAFF
jgi:hypothetical protein